MLTVEVPRADWARTLAAFTAVHDGWVVSVDLLGPDIGSQPIISNLPLLGGIRGSGRCDCHLRGQLSNQSCHAHRSRRHTPLHRADGRWAGVALGLPSTDGTETILRFRIVALPETVDGIARPHRA
jgi:hypothetical protein